MDDSAILTLLCKTIREEAERRVRARYGIQQSPDWRRDVDLQINEITQEFVVQIPQWVYQGRML